MEPRSMRRTMLGGALAACAVLPACDNTDPVSSQELALIVNAEPPAVTVGEASTITVSAFRPDGGPAVRAPVQMETTLGTLARSQFLLDRSGRGSTVLESGAEPGTATVSAIVTVGGLETLGSIDVEILAPEPPEAAIEVSPTALDQQHGRGADACPNPFEPPLTVSQIASGELDYHVVEDLPTWLSVDAPSGSVPAEVVASYTCDAGEGDLDLAHTLQLQATDRATGNDLGEPVGVAVTLRVRD